MECCSSLSFCVPKRPLPLIRTALFSSICSSSRKQQMPIVQLSAISYKKFINSALDETKRHTHLAPSPLQERYNSRISMDGKSEIEMLSFEATKVRLLRSLCIESQTMQVLDFAVFPEPEFDMPIFCANFFSSANTNIVVLDLNPLHDVISQRDYKEKYYKGLIPLGLKYAEAWLELMDQAVVETNASKIMCNREAQHRYLTWRAEKDPGHGLLKKLIGETQAKDLLVNFLFNGIDELGSKSFLDYFPEYCCEDGTINQSRSIIGKSFESRPWDGKGEFISNSFEN